MLVARLAPAIAAGRHRAPVRGVGQRGRCDQRGAGVAEMTRITASCRVLGFELRLITPDCALYYADADELDALQSEPWWAFVWPGSFALAELLQKRPELVRGKRVLDVASGCGISALASLQAGAAHVVANDIDPWSLRAVRLNLGQADAVWAHDAEAQGRLSCCGENLIGSSVADMAAQGVGPVDVILAGDICYEQPLAGEVRRWLASLLSRDQSPPPVVLIGDPGRAHFVDTFRPQSSNPKAASYFPDGSLGRHSLAPEREERGGKGQPDQLEIVAAHRSQLSGLIADTSHGLHTATVWELRLKTEADRAAEEAAEGNELGHTAATPDGTYAQP